MSTTFRKRVGMNLAVALPSVYPDQICKGVADVLDCPDIPNGVGSPWASSWIGEVTKMHLHFSEIKSQAGNSFVNLVRASLLFEVQHQRVAELFSCDNFLPACRPRRCSSNRGGALNLRTCKCPPCMSVIHGIHAEKLVPLNLPHSSYTAH